MQENQSLTLGITENVLLPGSSQILSNNLQKYISDDNTKLEKMAGINKRLVDSGFLSYDKRICYLTEYDEISKTANELIKWVDNQKNLRKIPVAFDMEWPWSPKTGSKKTALIQLCFTKDVCYLFQVWKFQKLPESLVTLLHHEKLFFNGNYVAHDFHKLRDDFPDVGDVDKIVENCCDLGQYANKVFGKNFIWSLNRLSKEFLDVYIDKDESLRSGEWEKLLNENQQIYAAVDVYASQLIYQKIKAVDDKQKIELLLEEIEDDFEN